MTDRQEGSSVPGAPAGEELREVLAAACGIVRQTRTLIEAALDKGFTHGSKADGSLVTEVDIAVEEKARALLASRFPAHGVIGEELPAADGGRALTWVIDPIDGTRSFRHRVPLYGTLLALLHRGEPILGIIDLPGLPGSVGGGERRLAPAADRHGEELAHVASPRRDLRGR